MHHENNVVSWLLPQWPCGNSCSWANDAELHIDHTNKPKFAQQAKQGAYISGHDPQHRECFKIVEGR